LTGQRRWKRALRKALTGVGRKHGHEEGHNQAVDDQDCCSGKIQWSPRLSPGEAIPAGLFTIPAGG
jgi:hypothetical protein